MQLRNSSILHFPQLFLRGVLMIAVSRLWSFAVVGEGVINYRNEKHHSSWTDYSVSKRNQMRKLSQLSAGPHVNPQI